MWRETNQKYLDQKCTIIRKVEVDKIFFLCFWNDLKSEISASCCVNVVGFIVIIIIFTNGRQEECSGNLIRIFM